LLPYYSEGNVLPFTQGLGMVTTLTLPVYNKIPGTVRDSYI